MSAFMFVDNRCFGDHFYIPAHTHMSANVLTLDLTNFFSFFFMCPPEPFLKYFVL